MPDEKVLDVLQILGNCRYKDSMQLFVFIDGYIKDFVVKLELFEYAFLKVRYHLLLFFFFFSSLSCKNQIVHVHSGQRIFISINKSDKILTVCLNYQF